MQSAGRALVDRRHIFLPSSLPTPLSTVTDEQDCYYESMIILEADEVTCGLASWEIKGSEMVGW